MDNKDQLLREEDNYIQMNKNDKCCLNSLRASLSEEEKKEYQKQYLEENKEQRKEQNKKYREENRQNINEKIKTKITCGCGSVFRNDDKSKHEKTNKHKSWLTDSIQNAETI